MQIIRQLLQGCIDNVTWIVGRSRMELLKPLEIRASAPDMLAMFHIKRRGRHPFRFHGFIPLAD